MAAILRYFTEFGKHAFQHITAEFMHESIVFCSMCTMSSYRKFTFAISFPDEFSLLITVMLQMFPAAETILKVIKVQGNKTVR